MEGCDLQTSPNRRCLVMIFNCRKGTEDVLLGLCLFCCLTYSQNANRKLCKSTDLDIIRTEERDVMQEQQYFIHREVFLYTEWIWSLLSSGCQLQRQVDKTRILTARVYPLNSWRNSSLCVSCWKSLVTILSRDKDCLPLHYHPIP